MDQPQRRDDPGRGEAARKESSAENGMDTGEQGLVPVTQEPPPPSLLQLHPSVGRLPVEIEVSVPIREFRVRNLLSLEAGRVISSQWGNGEDLPLAAGPVQLAWVEFEVIDTQLGVRVTRLV